MTIQVGSSGKEHMLRPLGALLGFERNKINEHKIKSYYSPWISKKLQHKKHCQILIGQPHKLSIETNLKQTCKEEYSHTKSHNIPNIQRKKHYT